MIIIPLIENCFDRRLAGPVENTNTICGGMSSGGAHAQMRDRRKAGATSLCSFCG
jgi:hypothetical protein